MKIFKNITNGYKKIATGIAIVSFLAVIYIALIPGGSVAQVISELSGAPIGNAFVKLEKYPQYNATTDSVTGEYTMPNVPVGDYLISASAPNYITDYTHITVGEGTNPLSFSLTEGTEFYLPFLYQSTVYDSGVQIVNNNATDASVTIEMFNSDGSSAGNIAFEVQSGKMVTKHVFDITATRPLFAGPAIVRSNVSVQVQGYILTLNGMVYSIGPSFTKTAYTAYLPFLYYSTVYNGAVQVFNPGIDSTNVTIKLLNPDGTIAGSKTYLVGPKVMIGPKIEDIITGVTFYNGPAIITSELPIVAQGFIRTIASKVYSIAPSVDATVTEAYLPFLYNSTVYNGAVQVFNPGTISTDVTITLYNVDGSIVSSNTYPVGPNLLSGPKLNDILPPGAFWNGPAKITSTKPVAVQGFIRTIASKVYSIAPQVRKPGSSSDVHIPYLISTTSLSHNGGIQVMNPGIGQANVKVALYYSNGTEAGNVSKTLNASEELSRKIFEIVPSSVTFDGYAIVTTDQPVVAQGFIRAVDSKIYSITPPVER